MALPYGRAILFSTIHSGEAALAAQRLGKPVLDTREGKACAEKLCPKLEFFFGYFLLLQGKRK